MYYELIARIPNVSAVDGIGGRVCYKLQSHVVGYGGDGALATELTVRVKDSYVLVFARIVYQLD